MATQTIKAPKPEKAPKPDIDEGLTRALRTKDILDTPFITSKSQLQTQITEAEGRAAKAKQEQEEMLVAGEKTGTEKEAQAVRGAQEAYQGKLQAEPLPAFIPTKDSVQDIAGLFSLISVIGAVAGKGNAQMALGNMNAMLEGYQKGRGDLYKKEAAEFDKNFKAMIKKHEEFRKEMEDAVKLAPYDKQQAMIDAKLAAVKAGSAIVNAQLDKGYLMDAYKTVDELQKGVDKAKETYEKQKAKEADIALKRELAYARMSQAGTKGGQSSVLLQGRAENIREAFVQAATDIVNITKFPPNTMLGVFSGLTGASADGMTSGIRNAIARGVTEKEQRMLESLLSGIEGHMAFALGGGYATSQSKARMDQYKAQIARAGDDPAQVPLMLARFRQEMNILSDNFPTKPGATPEMNVAVQKANDSINQAVPFTVDDVISAELGERKSSSPTPKPKGSGTKEDPIKLD
jgi:hypothetical protein